MVDKCKIASGNNINDYVCRLLYDRAFLKSEYCIFLDNFYDIQGVEGTIESQILFSALKMGKWNYRMREMLSGILWYADSQSVSDENLRLILSYPSKCRNTYGYVLGHKSLAFYQLLALNRYAPSFEVFSSLVDLICGNDCFTAADMLRILEDNTSVTKHGIRACITSARDKYGHLEKIAIADCWLRNNDRHK